MRNLANYVSIIQSYYSVMRTDVEREQAKLATL